MHALWRERGGLLRARHVRGARMRVTLPLASKWTGGREGGRAGALCSRRAQSKGMV